MYAGTNVELGNCHTDADVSGNLKGECFQGGCCYSDVCQADPVSVALDRSIRSGLGGQEGFASDLGISGVYWVIVDGEGAEVGA